jgi:hypothetical protein
MTEDEMATELDRLQARVKQLERLLRQSLIGQLLIINGRPAVTLAQAAKERDVAYWTARRRCEDGSWDAVYVRGDTHKYGARGYGRWWVYLPEEKIDETDDDIDGPKARAA